MAYFLQVHCLSLVPGKLKVNDYSSYLEQQKDQKNTENLDEKSKYFMAKDYLGHVYGMKQSFYG